jgi:DNA-binding NarL/FixJ family response regulator
MAIRILLADDHRIVRQGLRGLLERDETMTVVGEAGDGREAVAKAGELLPDVVLMDVTMPELNGLDATQKIRQQFPAVKVIGLSLHRDARQVAAMFKAGASGYLLKSQPFEELVGAIRTVLSGRTYISPLVANTDVLAQPPGVAAPGGRAEAGDRAGPGVFVVLTPREREVLQLLSEGRATKEVAAVLTVSVKTVETHRRQLMEKLQLHSIAELTKYAIREGLTTVDQ